MTFQLGSIGKLLGYNMPAGAVIAIWQAYQTRGIAGLQADISAIAKNPKGLMAIYINPPVFSHGGSGTITAGNTSINIAHGLGAIPTWALVSPKNADSMDCYITADATNVTVSIQFIQPNDTVFSWSAGV
jgi:hypothetical protein